MKLDEHVLEVEKEEQEEVVGSSNVDSSIAKRVFSMVHPLGLRVGEAREQG